MHWPPIIQIQLLFHRNSYLLINSFSFQEYIPCNFARIIALITVTQRRSKLYTYTLFQNVNVYTLNLLNTLASINSTIKVRKLRYFINLILLPLITISGMRHSSKVRRVFENIDSFDKEVKYLNTEIDHAACMRNDVVQIATASFVVILLNLMDYYALLDSDRTYMYVIMWILDRAPDFVYTVTICSFASLISKIRFRFETINSIEHIITSGNTVDSVTESSRR